MGGWVWVCGGGGYVVILANTPARRVAAAHGSAMRKGSRARDSGCPHGRRLSRCKECGGADICEHGRERRRCKECGGSGICEHGRMRSTCEECDGHVLVTLEATAVEGCEGEEEDARVSVFLPVEGGQVVWSVANYSGLVDSQTALS